MSKTFRIWETFNDLGIWNRFLKINKTQRIQTNKENNDRFDNHFYSKQTM